MEIRAVGDCCAVRSRAPFAQQVGRRRGDERLALLRRAGAEDERDTHDLELRGPKRVDGDAVGKRAAQGFGQRDVGGGGELRLFHRFAR